MTWFSIDSPFDILCNSLLDCFKLSIGSTDRSLSSTKQQGQAEICQRENSRIKVGGRQIPKLARGMRSFSTIDANSLPQNYKANIRRGHIAEAPRHDTNGQNPELIKIRENMEYKDEVTKKSSIVDAPSDQSNRRKSGGEYAFPLNEDEAENYYLKIDSKDHGRYISLNTIPSLEVDNISQKIETFERPNKNPTSPFPNKPPQKSFSQSAKKYVAIRQFLARRPDELNLR